MTVHETNRWAVGSVVEAKGPFAPESVHGEIVLRVRTPAHWQVLRSPHRMRVFEAIRSSGGCCIKELADALNSSTTALYYHLELLTKAGLILSTLAEPESGCANRGGRRPAIFMARGERVVVEYDPSNSRDRRRMTAIHQTWMAESLNEICPQAVNAPDSEMECASPALTNTSWEVLNQDEADEIREYLARVEAVLAQARARRDRSSGRVPLSSHHVAFSFTPVGEPVLPSPELVTRGVASLEPVFP